MVTLWIDRCINVFKWPAAILSLANLWFLFLQNVDLVLQTLSSSHQNFWIGLLVYLIVWRFFFASRVFGSWFPTFIHECVHVIFALLTFHRVMGFSVSWNKGGHVQYAGGVGNWLIVIAPYFFPLATLMAIALEATFPLGDKRSLVLGACFGFEVVYVWRQIHPKQSDFQTVGLPFVWMFLPGAILFGYGLLLSYLLLGAEGAISFSASVWVHTTLLLQLAIEFLQQGVQTL